MSHYLKEHDHERRYRKGCWQKQKNRRVEAKHGNQSKLFLSTMSRLKPFTSSKELRLERNTLGLLASMKEPTCKSAHRRRTRPQERRRRTSSSGLVHGAKKGQEEQNNEGDELTVVTDEVQKRQRLKQQKNERQQQLFSRISARSLPHAHSYNRSLQELRASREGELEDAVLAVPGVTGAQLMLMQGRIFVHGDGYHRHSVVSAVNHVGFKVRRTITERSNADDLHEDPLFEEERQDPVWEDEGACATLCASRVKKITGLDFFSADEVDRIVRSHFQTQQQRLGSRPTKAAHNVSRNEEATELELVFDR
jgi:hypothetical protein